ncbi:MAG: cyclic nucleotide-binding domain-containing protein [Gammaproteobacteria bacterium]|nr:cyclic nucleotide-binding domain-containing protein [Gammaproteobacteria bacterium]
MSSTSLELLQTMPIFGAISDESLKFLLERAKEVQVAKDDYFFRENDQGSSMFVLEEGRVAVLKSWVGQTQGLAFLNRGDCFGEMALIEMGARSASVQATEDCTAIEVSIDILHELYQHDLEQFTIIQMNMSREVCRRLRKADDLLFQVQMQTSTQDPNYRFYSG